MNIKSIVKNSLYTFNSNPVNLYLHQQEMKKRSRLEFTDLNNLAKRINMFSPYSNELHKPNDWYGHAKVIKKFLDLPNNYQFKFLLEHGVYLTNQIDRLDLETNLPSVVTYCDFRANLFKEYKSHVFSIGPFIHYATTLLSPEEIRKEKKRLGKSLLLFPNHSSLEIEIGYNTQELCKRVKKLSKDFDSVRVCLYWTDVILNKHKIYQDYGFECVTAGHTLDPLFLPRLRTYIESADVTVSNAAGTHVGYSLHLGKPHMILQQKLHLNANKFWKERIEEFWQSKPFNEVLEAFTTSDFKITAKQRKVVETYWGIKNVKSKKELKQIVTTTEKIYQKEK